MLQVATPRTLSLAVLPDQTLLRQALLVLAGVIFIGLSAQVSWDYPVLQTKAGEPVPITGQTFAVLVTGALLGARLGTVTVFAYLAAGVCGAPVFADWSRYYTTFSGATGGYLIGFLLAAFIVGWFAERGWDRSSWILLPMLIANAVIYIPGLIWLDGWKHVMGFHFNTFDAGLWPFILGDLLKLAAAALVLPAGWSIAQQFRGDQK